MTDKQVQVKWMVQPSSLLLLKSESAADRVIVQGPTALSLTEIRRLTAATREAVLLKGAAEQVHSAVHSAADTILARLALATDPSIAQAVHPSDVRAAAAALDPRLLSGSGLWTLCWTCNHHSSLPAFYG